MSGAGAEAVGPKLGTVRDDRLVTPTQPSGQFWVGQRANLKGWYLDHHLAVVPYRNQRLFGGYHRVFFPNIHEMQSRSLDLITTRSHKKYPPREKLGMPAADANHLHMENPVGRCSEDDLNTTQ